MQWVVRYPEKLSVPLSEELVLSFAKPGFVDALRAIMDYDYRDRLPEIEIPVLIVWGRQDLLVPLQRAAARVPRGRGRARGRRARDRPRYGFVTAPSEALETSFAYFASTPCSNAGGGLV